MECIHATILRRKSGKWGTQQLMHGKAHHRSLGCARDDKGWGRAFLEELARGEDRGYRGSLATMPYGPWFAGSLSRRYHRFLLGDLFDEFLAGVEVLVYQARRGVGQPLSGGDVLIGPDGKDFEK